MALRNCFLTAFNTCQDPLLDLFKSSQVHSRLWFFVLTLYRCILGSIHRSALVLWWCCSSPVEGSFTGKSCIHGANTNSLFPIASESCMFIWRSDSYQRFAKWKKMYTYFICNLENNLFQVLSSTVSTQAMQRLTAGQGAMKTRPLGKVPLKYFKWRKKEMLEIWKLFS